MKKPAVSGDKRMTVREVAEVLGCTPEAIKQHIRELFPVMMKNGKTTYVTEAQVAIILEKMKQGQAYAHHVSNGDIAAYNSGIVGTNTSKSRALRIDLLHRQIEAEMEAEIMELKSELSSTKELLTQRTNGLATIQRIAEAGGLIRTDREDMLDTYRRDKNA